MGLLDDAIREHLELKRLKGVDPGEVAREEQDALGPVRRGGEAEPDRSSNEDRESSRDAEESSVSSFEPFPASDTPSAGQETIELNMEAELAATSDPGHSSEAGSRERAASEEDTARSRVASGESLEWEIPSDRSSTLADSEASSEAGSPAGGEQDPAEPVEDVLEETPDFLRDTPEQERLWFEQRPPRDFDFNE
jgi:hypothetical protein